MSQALPPGTRRLAEVDSGTAGFSRGRWPGQWGAGTLGTRLGSGRRHRSQRVRTVTESHWPACPPRAPAPPGRRVGQLGAVTQALPHLLKGCPRAELLSWGSQGLSCGSHGGRAWPRWCCPGPRSQRGARSPQGRGGATADGFREVSREGRKPAKPSRVSGGGADWPPAYSGRQLSRFPVRSQGRRRLLFPGEGLLCFLSCRRKEPSFLQGSALRPHRFTPRRPDEHSEGSGSRAWAGPGRWAGRTRGAGHG